MQPVSSSRPPFSRPAPAPRPDAPALPPHLLWWLVTFIALVSVSIAWAEPAPAPTSPLTPGIRISQIYGGGGMAGAPYQNDFIELFNGGTTIVDLTGWSVQYAIAGQNNWLVTLLSGSIPPGGYYLIREAAGLSCSGGTAPCGMTLPAVNASGSINLGFSRGKLVLSSAPDQFLSVPCPSGETVIDVVGYGSTPGCIEGAGSAPAASATTALFRNGDGCTDTDDNGADFSAAAPAPRNASTPENSCAPLAVELSLFTAASEGSGISLAWETVSETDNAGFNIYRAEAESGPWIRANATMIPAAAPGASLGHAYRWTDAGVAAGASYWYLLETVDLGGSVTRHGPVVITVFAPNAVKLAAASATRHSGAAFAVIATLAVAAGWWVWRRRG